MQTLSNFSPARGRCVSGDYHVHRHAATLNYAPHECRVELAAGLPFKHPCRNQRRAKSRCRLADQLCVAHIVRQACWADIILVATQVCEGMPKTKDQAATVSHVHPPQAATPKTAAGRCKPGRMLRSQLTWRSPWRRRTSVDRLSGTRQPPAASSLRSFPGIRRIQGWRMSEAVWEGVLNSATSCSNVLEFLLYPAVRDCRVSSGFSSKQGNGSHEQLAPGVEMKLSNKGFYLPACPKCEPQQHESPYP